MEERELKEVMEKVHIKREMEEEIMKKIVNTQNEKQQAGKHINNRGKMVGWQSKAAAAAIALMVAGVGGVTVHAIVGNLVKERMESMPEKEVESILNQVDTSDAGADTYSRELTAKEKERREELSIAYYKGQFPQEELKKVQDESQIDKDVLCFVPATSYMYLPDRELTDEEILQIIDYYEKRDYSLEERYKETHPEKEQEQKKLKEQVKAEGGISEEEAIAKAKEYLDKEYGEDGDGMEVDHYLISAKEAEGWSIEVPDGKPVYRVTYSIRGIKHYYFAISSTDGTLLLSDCSTAD